MVGKIGGPLCPVEAVLRYLIIRGNSQDPLFKFSKDLSLTRARLVSQVQGALTKVGVDSTPYSGHSFCSGAATTAARMGVED